jgi:hypothetical protein
MQKPRSHGLLLPAAGVLYLLAFLIVMAGFLFVHVPIQCLWMALREPFDPERPIYRRRMKLRAY